MAKCASSRNAPDKPRSLVAIETHLDHYIDLPTPHYAVMLDGPWGSGKTHFIKEWLEQKKKALESPQEKEAPSKYVYVSLSGLSTRKEIYQAWSNARFPWLNHWGTKAGIALVKGLSSKFLGIDTDEDGKNETFLDPGIALTALEQRSLDPDSSPSHVLVFDDLERWLGDPEIALGVMSDFLEQRGCHVIILTNEKEVAGGSAKTSTLDTPVDPSNVETPSPTEAHTRYHLRREKVVGKTLYMESHIEAALPHFMARFQESLSYESLRVFTPDLQALHQHFDTQNLRLLRRVLNEVYSLTDVLLTTLRPIPPGEQALHIIRCSVVWYATMLYAMHTSNTTSAQLDEWLSMDKQLADAQVRKGEGEGQTLIDFKKKIRSTAANVLGGWDMPLTFREIVTFLKEGSFSESTKQALREKASPKELSSWKLREFPYSMADEQFLEVWSDMREQFDDTTQEVRLADFMWMISYEILFAALGFENKRDLEKFKREALENAKTRLTANTLDYSAQRAGFDIILLDLDEIGFSSSLENKTHRALILGLRDDIFRACEEHLRQNIFASQLPEFLENLSDIKSLRNHLIPTHGPNDSILASHSFLQKIPFEDFKAAFFRLEHWEQRRVLSCLNDRYRKRPRLWQGERATIFNLRDSMSEMDSSSAWQKWTNDRGLKTIADLRDEMSGHLKEPYSVEPEPTLVVEADHAEPPKAIPPPSFEAPQGDTPKPHTLPEIRTFTVMGLIGIAAGCLFFSTRRPPPRWPT